jgi:ribosomal protein S18 acetylase RimI-like enzyme
VDSSLRSFRLADLDAAVTLSRAASARPLEQVGKPLWSSREDAEVQLGAATWIEETLLVAEDEGGIAGVGGLDPDGYPHVFGPLVAPRARGRKLGTTLLAATLELALERELESISAWVGARNVLGRLLLERHGFLPREKPDAVYRLLPGMLRSPDAAAEDVELRRGVARDLDAILVLYREAFPTASRPAETWLEWLARGEVYVAEAHGELAAFVHVGRGWATHLGVSEVERGRGIGATVIARVLADYWQEHPGEQLRLSVKTDNLPAIRLYRRLGFAPELVLEAFDLAL